MRMGYSMRVPDYELVWNDGQLKAAELEGFFVGWPNPPSGDVALKIVNAATEFCVARYEGRVAGFITVLSDGFYFAYVPLLEVLPTYQRKGIGKALVRAVKERYNGFYKVDVLCDLEAVVFYQQLGFEWVSGATLANYDAQSTGKD